MVGIWDIQQQAWLHNLDMEGYGYGFCDRYVFSRDQSILALGVDSEILVVIDTNSWQVIKTIHQEYSHFDISPDNQKIAIIDPPGKSLTVINIATEDEHSFTDIIQNNDQSLFNITSAAVSPDGRYIAWNPGDYDSPVMVWDMFSGQLAARLRIEEDDYQLEFSPDGSRLMGWSSSGGQQWLVNNWQEITGEPVGTRSPDNQWLANLDDDTIRVYRLDDLSQPYIEIYGAEWSEFDIERGVSSLENLKVTERYLVAQWVDAVYVWDLNAPHAGYSYLPLLTPEEIEEMRWDDIDNEGICSTNMDVQGDKLLAYTYGPISEEDYATLWDLSAWHPLQQLSEYGDVSFGPDGSFFLIGNTLSRIGDNSQATIPISYPDGCPTIHFSANGMLMVVLNHYSRTIDVYGIPR